MQSGNWNRRKYDEGAAATLASMWKGSWRRLYGVTKDENEERGEGKLLPQGWDGLCKMPGELGVGCVSLVANKSLTNDSTSS